MSRPVTGADELLVVCLCAAWCGTCRDFAPDFDSVARAWPRARFAWIDIEDHPEVLGDEDIETFPTVLITDARRVAFYGAIEPRSSTLQALVAQASEPGASPSDPPLTDLASRARLHAHRDA